MNLQLSILDQSSIISVHTPARAVAETEKLAAGVDLRRLRSRQLLAREFGLQ